MIRLFLTAVVVFLICSNNSTLASKEDSAIDYNDILSIVKIIDPHERRYALEEYIAEADDYLKFFTLSYLAVTCIESGNYDLAQKHASNTLALAEKYSNNWNYGNAVHDSYMVLGIVALSHGLVDEAILHLMMSSEVPTSPQLQVYGPNMMLVDALLDYGIKDEVIDHLESVKKLWLNNDGQLDSWIYAIKGGGKPYFGLNLPAEAEF